MPVATRSQTDNKMSEEMEKGIKTLIDSVNEVKNDLTQIKESMNSVTTTNTNIEKRVGEVSKRLDNLEGSLLKADEKYNTLLKKYEQLQEKVISMESYSRRDNLLIYGIPEAPLGAKESNDDCIRLVRNFFENQLEISHAPQIPIVRCHRLGPPPNPNPRPGSKPVTRSIIVRFQNYGDRQDVWQAKKKLKDTQFYINEDFPTEITERRKKLMPIMYAARRAELIAYLVVDKLHIIDGDKHDVYDVNRLDNLPKQLDPNFVMTRKSNDVFAFFGWMCPLSNFHPSPFLCENRTFRWVEEYFFHKKAQLVDDQGAIQRLIKATSPAECKNIGKSIKVDKRLWQNSEVSFMQKALYEKFRQNPDLREYLLATGELTIAESSPHDKFWGTGVGLGREDATKQQLWKGKNKLGELLMVLREELKDI